MQLFISIILLCATFVSVLKLALMPRFFSILFALSFGVCASLFSDELASSSLTDLLAQFSSIAVLQNWCIMVVIQELIVVLLTYKRLSVYAEGRKPKLYTSFVYVPSVMMFAGCIWLKLICFNTFIGLSFEFISWMLIIAIPLGILLFTEIFRLFVRSEAYVSLLDSGEKCLIFLGIFLPVLVQAEFRNIASLEVDYMQSIWLILFILVSSVCLGFIVTQYKKHTNKKVY